MLRLFFEEPDPDRWLPYDRVVRRWTRRLVRGRPKVSGHRRVFINLLHGLRQLGVRYSANPYAQVARRPEEPVCIIGQPFVLDKFHWQSPILFGASGYSHPCMAPDLLDEFPIRRILVPGEWMRKMCEPQWGDAVSAWPVGINTESWKEESTQSRKQKDFLIYDKVRWRHDEFEESLIQPVRDELRRRNFSFTEIRYGYYKEVEFRKRLAECRSMIFLCEHETQGLAYQQALSCNVPILAWDRGGFWQDPAFYPDRVCFQPVSTVPYWDERCGLKFAAIADFPERLQEFRAMILENRFAPRQYILDNLTLKKASLHYLRIAADAFGFDELISLCEPSDDALAKQLSNKPLGVLQNSIEDGGRQA